MTQKTHFKKAQVTWKIVNSVEAKTKKQYIIRQAHKTKRDNYLKDNLSGVPTREEGLQLLPHDEEGIKLRAAISAERRFMSYYEKEISEKEEVRKFQVENAFMTSEVALLKKRLSHLQTSSKRLSWVDSLLLRLDKMDMAKLKKAFTNKLGVVSLDA